MHRKLISVWFILFIILISVHADYSRWLTGQVSAGTSAVIYGDKDFRTFNKTLLADDFKRFMFTLMHQEVSFSMACRFLWFF